MEDIQRVLVVDDDPVTLTLVRHILEQAYFDVFTAASGEDALNLIKLKRIPHLAIVDINMPPGMDGFTFCTSRHLTSSRLRITW
jgi:CheY-like chemotaxis protein